MKAVIFVFLFWPKYLLFNKIFIRILQLVFFRVFYCLSFLLVLGYFYGRPCESKLGSCYTLVWLEISLLISLLLLYIYVYMTEIEAVAGCYLVYKLTVSHFTSTIY